MRIYALLYGLARILICEKPLVINPWNLDGLAELEHKTGIKIYNLLQLRLHPFIIALKKEIEYKKVEKKHEIDLTYITSRGKWYFYSWKANSRNQVVWLQMQGFIFLIC